MNKKKIFENTGSFHELVIDSLKDPEKASAYLQVALEEYQEDGDYEFFLTALRNIAEAQGGIASLAKKTELNRTHLYQLLSKNGNPRFDTLILLLKKLGFYLTIKPNNNLKYATN